MNVEIQVIIIEKVRGKAMSQEIYVKPKQMTATNVVLIIFGSIIYAFSVNYFIVPLKLFSGGVPGTAQMIRSLFFSNVTNVDLAGILNLGLNVPLFFLAYRTMKKRMVIGTIISVLIQTVIFTYTIAPSTPILDDKLACLILAGVIGGFGCGLILSNGASGGGLDLLGLYFSHKQKANSVGSFTIAYNVFLYSLMAILFSLPTALYSILYIVIYSVTIDRYHLQNIEVKLMVFTHESKVKDMIMKEYSRGVTCWEGKGAYTNQSTEVLVTICSKSEVEQIKKDIRALDEKAFVISTSVTDIRGGYQKRLV